jgi:hypothetical protein
LGALPVDTFARLGIASAAEGTMKDKGESKDNPKDKDKKKVRLALEDLEADGKDVKGGAAKTSTYMCPW